MSRSSHFEGYLAAIGHVSKAQRSLEMNIVMAIVPEESDGGLAFWPE
jgi:hypothetical protein